MKHAIRHVHFVVSMSTQSKSGLRGAVPTDAAPCHGGLTA